MKHFYTFLVALLFTSFGFGQSNPGDIAFIAYNSDGTDDFAFVTLVDIPINTEIWFTDNEWNGSAFNDLNEGEVLWTATAAISAGTVIIVNSASSNPPTVNIGSISGSNLNLGASNETLFALLEQPATSMPSATFLAGISNDLVGSGAVLTNTGLTEGIDFINFADDNDGFKYTGSITSEVSFFDYLPLIMDIANFWQVEASDGTLILPISTTAFTVTGGSPTVGFDSSSSTENETNTTFTSSNIPVTVTNYDGNQIDIDVSVTGGTAEPGDYAFTSPTSLSFTADGTQNITIDINDDADFDDETVELTITETSSVTGLVISQATHTVTIVDDETPALPNIVINEILADPTGIDANGDGIVSTTEDEFVELVNNEIFAVDITGYTLSDAIGIKHVFGSIILPAGGSVVVFGGGTPMGISGASETASTGNLQLNNGGDTVTLEDTSNNVVATYTYGGEGGNDQSLGRNEDIFGGFVQHTTIQTNPVAASPGLYNTSGLPFSTITWKGSIDTDWTNGGNWSDGNSPTVLDDILILNVANAPIIASPISVNNATVNPGASLTISSSGSLSASTLNLFSFSNSFSSLISDGSITGTVTYNRYVNTNNAVNGNDLISAPLSGQTFDVFIGNNTNILANPTGTNVLFGGFDNNDAINPFELWDETDTTPLTAGVGYRTGIDPVAGSNLVSFEGTVNNSLVEVAINQGSASILNLVGNPYPSYLDAQAFLTQNAALLDPSAVVIYGYNDSTDGTSANDYTIISAIENNTLNIAPGQGFFVASNLVGGNLQFTTNTPDMRLISTDDDFIAGRTSSSAITNVNINLSNATDNFITKVYFTASSGLGLDPGYDASLLGGVAPAFSIFSQLVEDNTGIPFATQAVGETDYNDVTIALGLNANMGEQLTFSIAENTLPPSIEVYLDDTLTSTSTLLNTSDYVLTPSEDLNGTGRFYLRFSNSALSTTDNVLEAISIYTNQSNKTVNIAGLLIEGTFANVYDIQGRLVNSKKLASNIALQTIDVNSLNTGVYIVKLTNGATVKTQKIILK